MILIVFVTAFVIHLSQNCDSAFCTVPDQRIIFWGIFGSFVKVLGLVYNLETVKFLCLLDGLNPKELISILLVSYIFS